MRKALAAILLMFAFSGHGQDLLRLNIQHTESSGSLPGHFISPRFYPDSLTLRAGVDSLLAGIMQYGYFDAVLKELVSDSAGYTAIFNRGELFHWHLRNSNISAAAIRSSNLERYFEGTPLPFYQFHELQKKIIGWYENNGYPFASLHADSVNVKENYFRAVLRLEPSYMIVFDTVQLIGNVSLSNGFIAGLTGIRPGLPYSEQKARAAPPLLSDLPFLRLNGEPNINFTPGSAILEIPVRRQPSNRFDGIAGISGNALDENRIQLTGQFNLLLVNLFERGESFSMNWQGMGQGTQRLLLEGSWPFLLSTPLTPSMLFSLHKQDTSYLSLRQRPAFSWQSHKRIMLSVFADLQSTQLLSTSRFSNITTVPPQIDSRTRLFGIEASTHSPGFLTTLQRGRGARAWLAAGTKKIIENAALPPEIYQSIIPSQNQFAFGLQAETRHAVGPQSALVFQLKSQGITGQQFFENELFRIGGFRSLKGFDEESILATTYAIMTGEWRYFLAENSYISLLFNAAWYERKISNNYLNGFPWGAATGITIETAPGIISVYYALGKGPETPLAFRNAKVHIGFVSLF